MESIDKQIKWYEQNSTRKDDDIIKANLKLINELTEKIEHSEDRIFINKVVNTFCEIIEIQREIIDELEFEHDNVHFGGGMSKLKGFMALTDLKPVDAPCVKEEGCFDISKLRELNSYKPSGDGFGSDAEIRDSFANYLKYHLVKKNGQQKVLADTTVYDYCSRVKVLWEIYERERMAGALDEKCSQLDKEILPGKTFINAYNNIDTLKAYVERKSKELEEIEIGERELFSMDELQSNPLNNPKNLRNTKAALTKFEEFRKKLR